MGKIEPKEALKNLFLFYYEHHSNRTCLSGVYRLPSGKEIQSSLENPKYFLDYMKIRMDISDKESIEAAFKAFGYDIEEVPRSYVDDSHMELVGYIEEHLETEYDGEIEIGEFYNQYFVDLDAKVKWLEKWSDAPKWYEYDKAVGMALADYESARITQK